MNDMMWKRPIRIFMGLDGSESSRKVSIRLSVSPKLWQARFDTTGVCKIVNHFWL